MVDRIAAVGNFPPQNESQHQNRDISYISSIQSGVGLHNYMKIRGSKLSNQAYLNLRASSLRNSVGRPTQHWEKPTLQHSSFSACPQFRSMFTISLIGDVMLGRLIDQLLPQHVDSISDARTISKFVHSHPELKSYSFKSPWGNALPLLCSSNLVLANLETSVTTHPIKWPEKVFNYRMHPANVQCLVEGGVKYVSLANNHTLDFSEEGLMETIDTVNAAGIVTAGAGKTTEQATIPATLTLNRTSGNVTETVHNAEGGEKSSQHQIHLYSFSDHPSDWSKVPSFNLLNYATSFRSELKKQLLRHHSPSLKIVSIHWGPNYRWHPSREQVSLAHFLIDECKVDIIHGHSSHHVQGVSVYHGKLIIYGCGDFVDDYAVDANYRNDLSAVWRVHIVEEALGMKVTKLEVFPTRIQRFQAHLLSRDDADHTWVSQKIRELSADLGTKVDHGFGEEGQLVLHVGG